MHIPEYELSVSDKDVFEALDLNYPGLEDTKEAYEKGDMQGAKAALVEYMRTRKEPFYYYDYRALPLEKMETDSTPYFFQAALGLNGSLKEFCLYGADRLLENTYVLPGKGRGEAFLGRNYENMIHFNFLEDQGKRHRHYLDMFVRGQFFEYLAVAYHETGDRRYVEKFMEILEVFFKTYPLKIVDKSPTASRFQFDEDRDVMSVGWLTLVYTSLFYTRLPYEIPSELAFEIIKRIWFFGIQFRRFDTDTYRAYNHHLWERGLVPFILGTMYPEIPDFVAMKDRGVEIVRRHTLEDFNTAGGYSEHSIAYWSGAALGEMTTRGMILARLNGYPLLGEEAEERIRKTFNLLAILAPPGERYPSIGDNRGPMVNPVLGLGNLAIGEEGCRALLAKRTGMPVDGQLPPLDYANDTAGFTVSRNGYEKDCDYYVMSTKCNCGYTGHNHMDLISLCITMNGEEIIGEPYAGKLYHNIKMGSQQRGYMYNMSSHNTVLCYGRPIQENAMYANKWGVYRPDTPISAFISNGQCSYVKASHSAYTFCRHVREVTFARKSGSLFIRDTVERGNRLPDAHIQRWHLMDDCTVTAQGDGWITLAKNGTRVLMLWDKASSLEVWKNDILYPAIYPDESQVFPIIDARFIAPEAKSADNVAASLNLAILDITGKEIDKNGIDQLQARLKFLTENVNNLTVDEMESGCGVDDFRIIDDLEGLLYS